mmetsp:Transcript_23658/g.52637  ORF Transcript_23658/g.52637 Transcript_23658/m.52637 type:complete len:438 (-) Transcript_23658:1021-2334(-)
MDGAAVPPRAVTETLSEAAARVLSDSFAVYRVDAAVAARIRAAHRSAAAFFRDTAVAATTARDSRDDGAGCNSNNNKKKKRTFFLSTYRRVVKGNLYGYNIPLPSKELFRTWHDCSRCGCGRGTSGGNNNNNNNNENDEKEQELERFRRRQPWPSNELCTASFRLAKDLHALLSECLWQITLLDRERWSSSTTKTNGAFGRSSCTGTGTSTPLPQQPRDPAHRPSPGPSFPLRPRKRSRRSRDGGTSGVVPGKNDDDRGAGTGHGSDAAATRNETNNNTNEETVPPLLPPSRTSPLDFFFYHNRVPGAVNCSEHTDRGALVVVCLTDVPGLEVLLPPPSSPSNNTSPSSSCFVCPGVLVRNPRQRSEDDACRCSDLVCIVAGDQLTRLLSSSSSSNRNEATATTTTATTVRACVHRVRNPLKRARLSISYELRLEEP